MGSYAWCERRFIDEEEKREEVALNSKKNNESMYKPLIPKPQKLVIEDNITDLKFANKIPDSNNCKMLIFANH